MKLLGYAWFTSNNTIGIVLCESKYDGKKAYIKSVDGNDMDSDLKSIMDYGAKFPVEEAESVIKKIGITL